MKAQYEKVTAQRTTAMTGSFLRASLFTSVVAYGVSALVIGLGILFLLLGWALRSVSKRLVDAGVPAATTGPASRPNDGGTVVG